ncbi:AtpZ/AtpI family protein [Rheinheimera baltica]|uniref:AtpZ/AtpI family protein n=1 Tax=Rheinheimera baltica TaxID=67576 RepID=UPI00273DF0AD|nr:AtpZ/AtpI family protein [Rheinheimera baltica]MDP5190583.1 AtpZ/AtpI family protein [Rheinheimera baltica]
MNNKAAPKPGSTKADSVNAKGSKAVSDKTDRAAAAASERRGAGFSQKVGDIAARKLQAQHNVTKNVWSGLGMMGLIGWSVVVPTLLGAALGMWLDKRYPSAQSWTLMLLVAGLCLGCFNAWRWVEKEDHDIHQHGGNDDVD